MKRIRLSNREIKELANSLGKLGEVLREADVVEIVEVEGGKAIYIVDGIPALYKSSITSLGEFVIPTLYLIHKTPMGQKITAVYPAVGVDAGAVKHILNGADVMRPGIREIAGDFEREEPLFILDDKRRTIAVGVSLYSRRELENLERGKVVHNVHYLGDKIWRLALELAKE